MHHTLALWTIVLLFALSQNVVKADDIVSQTNPQIDVSDLFFQAQAKAVEGGQGGLDPLLWRLGLTGRFTQDASLKVSIGAPTLLYRPKWSTATTDSMSLMEAKATMSAAIASVSAGQLRIPWGLEGQTDEEQMWFPRSLLYEKGYFPLFDQGVMLTTDTNGYYAKLTVHNGEGAGLTNLDNRYFLTGVWGYKGPAHVNLGFSGTAGRIAAPLTIPGGAGEAHIRGANVFFGVHVFGLGIQFEPSFIETATETLITDAVAWHVDVEHPITDSVLFLGRFEQLNPNVRVSGQAVLGRGMVGCEFHNKNSSSRLFFLLVKNTETIGEIPNDEARLVWRLSPPQDD